MKLNLTVAVAVSALAIAGLVGLLWVGAESPTTSDETGEPLVLFCAAGVQPPVVETVKQYEAEFGVPVQIQYGGSGTLLANITAAPTGDLYLAGDSSYVDIAHERGLVAERIPLAVMTPVLAVRRGNPQHIESLVSLLDPQLKIGLGITEGSAIGRISRRILKDVGLWEQVSEATNARGVFKPTVPDLANDVKIGTVDVAILFDATVRQYPELEPLAIPREQNVPQEISVGVLTNSRRPTEALHFGRYLAARDRGLVHFEKLGYEPVDGDEWADTPRLRLLSGGVLRPAIQQTLRDFEKREGVEIDTDFNGCGILVAGLKAGKPADAYFACDVSFMTQVSDMFREPLDVSRTRMVICVQKGNPRGLRTLDDLEKQGLKLGVTHPQYSALGALTERLLHRTGHYERVMKNVSYGTAPTADMLIAHMRTHHLDAAIVYEVNAVNAMRVKDDLEYVPIPEASATAVQPVAVAKQSHYPYLTGRLVEALRAARSQKRFVESGFSWLETSRPEQSGPR